MYHIAETTNIVRKLMAWLRKNRICEDNITRLIQKIIEEFDQKPQHRTVLVLLDFSKTYDTVWPKLLLSM